VGCAYVGLSLAFPFVFRVMVLAINFYLIFLSPLFHQQALQQLTCDVFVCLCMSLGFSLASSSSSMQAIIFSNIVYMWIQ
jgi:hypothetical protein